MMAFDVQFHPSDSNPTGQALEYFGEKDDDLLAIMEAEIWELANSHTLSHTYITHVEGNMWCLYGYHKGNWGFIFLVQSAKNTIVLLNGYSKRLRNRVPKMPRLSAGQIRKAKYLVRELQYA